MRTLTRRQHRFSFDCVMLARLLDDFRSSRLKDLKIDSEFRASESLVVEVLARRALRLTDRH